MNKLASTRHGVPRFATWAVVVTSFSPVALLAQTANPTAARAGYSTSPVIGTQAALEAYWTPQRLLSAVPKELHAVVGRNGLPTAPPEAASSATPVKAVGAAPTIEGAEEEKVLIPEPYLHPDAFAIATGNQPAGSITPTGTSSVGAYFTTHRVFPNGATTTYPNRAAGKLFFSDPRTGGNFVCSGAVLRHRVVVTAGHCVANASTDPNQRYFYTNFMFVPAYRNGNAPVGTWTPSLIGVTNEWYFSNGSVPNAQDVGMMVMRDDGSGRRIGERTGYLGYFTLQLAKNHATMLGYPTNLDRGLRMQINSAFTFGAGGNNTYVYGNAMRGGSSGGPWIMDYGVAPNSNPSIPSGFNYLIAVTSYGPIATEPKYQGASNLDSRFLSLLSVVCGSASTGNCN
jgi:V8-like Glu-specific endopeptidase